MHACRRLLLAVLCVLVLCSTSAWCQLPGVRLPKVKIEGVGLPQVPIPSVADLLKEEPPLATALADGLPRLPLLDGWEPADLSEPWAPVHSAEGGFVLEPGTYELDLDSFCLHAGTHGPGKRTEGYLHGPYRGARAELLRTIVRRYASTPEATRQEAQALLWAVLARSDLSKATGSARAGADKLLTPQEVAGLSGGPWGALPDSLKRELRKQLSPAQRALFDAQDKLRSLLTKPTTSFAQLERLAVRTGNPSRSEDDVALPDACWNLHPGGALVRYVPHGYSRTTVQMHVPSPVGVERDAAGRVQRVWDAWGGVMEVIYSGGEDLVRRVRLTDGAEECVLESGAAGGVGAVEVQRWGALEPLVAGAAGAAALARARDIALLGATARSLARDAGVALPDWAADVLDAVDDGALAACVAAAGRPVVDAPPPPVAPEADSGSPPEGSDRPDVGGGSQGTPDGGGTGRPSGDQAGARPEGGATRDGNGGRPGGDRAGAQPGGEPGGGRPESGGAPDGGGGTEQPDGGGEAGRQGGEQGGEQGGSPPDGDGAPDGGEASSRQPGGNEGGAQPGAERGGPPDRGTTPGGTRKRGGSRKGGTDGGPGTTTVHFDPTDGMALPGTTGRQRLGISSRPGGDGSGGGGSSDTPRKKRGKPRRNRPRPQPGNDGGRPPGEDTGGNPPEDGGAPEGNDRPGGNDGGNPPGPDTCGSPPNESGAPEGNDRPGGNEGGNPPGPDTGGSPPNGGGAPEGNMSPGGGSTPGKEGGNPGGGAPGGG